MYATAVPCGVTYRIMTSEVAGIARPRRRSPAKRRRVHEMLVERRIFHLKTNDCSNSLTTLVMDHYRTAGGHHRCHPVILRFWTSKIINGVVARL